MIGVGILLLVAEWDEMVAFGPFGPLGFHLGFAAPNHVGFDARVELVEIPVAGRPAPFVEFIKFAVEAEQRAKDGWVEEIH